MTTNKSATDEAVISALVERWVTGCTKNINGILAIDSPELLMFDLPGPIESTGIGAYERTWDLCFSWSQESGAFNLAEIAADNDVAFVAALVRRARLPSSEQREELWFRLTIGTHKIGDQWIVTHEYHSIPANWPP